MEVLTILGSLLAIAAAVAALVFGVWFAIRVVSPLLWGLIVAPVLTNVPTILGIVACCYIWKAGHDNIGVVTGVVGLVSNYWWAKWYTNRKWYRYMYDPVPKSDSDPMSDKRRIYSKDGEVIGYEDRE